MDEQETTAVETLENDILDGIDFSFEDDEDAAPAAQADTEAQEPQGEQTADQAANQQPEAAPEPQKLRVRYNGQDMEVGLDEAPELVQKGLNYDHVRSELETFRKDEGLQAIDRLAQNAGLSRLDFVKQIQGAVERQQQAALEQQGYTREAAQAIMERDRQIQRQNQELQAYKAQQESLAQQEREKAQHKAQFEQFSAAYPEVDVTKIPKEVYQAVAGGDSLLGAYRTWENAQLRAKLAALETNKQAATRAPGSVSGAAPLKDGDKDPFAEAFWSTD